MFADILTSIGAVIVVLGIMIVVHELGHFVAAKLCHVRVDIFSIGFGPRIWGYRRGDTDYRLSALPFGGYVKMAGDNPSEECRGEPYEFLARPRWQRGLIAVAGPAMNIATAFLLLAGLFIFRGIPYAAFLDRPVVVVEVPQESPAARAGIQPGDHIVRIGSTENPTWEQALELVTRSQSGAMLPLILDRAGRRLETAVQVVSPSDWPRVLGYAAVPPVIDEVVAGSPAYRAGLKGDDEILALDGRRLHSSQQFVEGVRQSRGQVLHITVRRGTRELTFNVQPAQGTTPQGESVWQVGVGLGGATAYKRVRNFEATRQAAVATVVQSRAILGIVGQLFTGRVSVKQLQGVVGIARESGQAARRGAVRVILFMAVISLNLGILNLLPIPILDGGHILVLTIEGMLRRDLSVTLKERFVQVGLVFLLVIFAIVMYNDVLRLIPSR